MLLQFSQFFPLFPSSLPPQPSSIPPPSFMSMGCTYKFFESSVSYTIFISPHLFYAYQLCFIPCTSPPLFLPSHTPLKSLHVMSISLILFLL